MKKIRVVLLLFCIMGVGVVNAAEDGHGHDHMTHDDDSMHHGYGMMNGRAMMGSGMAGSGMMMGRGFMHQGGPGCSPMMGRGMMHQGWQRGMPMMGRGPMGHRGMMMGGAMMGLNADQHQKLMDDTVKLRKKMHMLHFEYKEAARNPKTTLEELGNMEQEMLDMRKDMMKKIDSLRNKK